MREQRVSGAIARLGRAAAVGGLIGLAIVALLSGSDRQAREFPSSPSYVGWPYDTGAARAKALLAFVRTGPASAIPYARRAILSDPISAQAVSILGRSQLYAQQFSAANRSFSVSGQLGWRETMTQIYWLDQALLGGDYQIGAQRLDAILRQAPLTEERDRFVSAIAATPEGRAALADRLKLAPIWAKPLMSEVWHLPADQVLQRVDLMRRTGKGVWACADSEKISQRLIDLGLIDEAQSVWRLNCGTSHSLVYDGSFEHFDTLKTTTAFDWQLFNRGDANISIAQDPSGNRSLALEVTASITLPIVRQFVVLKPGRYRLVWHTPDTPQSQTKGLRVSLTCKSDLSFALGGMVIAGESDAWYQDFSIGNDCAGRQLIFWLAPHLPVHLDDVSLDAIG